MLIYFFRLKYEKESEVIWIDFLKLDKLMSYVLQNDIDKFEVKRWEVDSRCFKDPTSLLDKIVYD